MRKTGVVSLALFFNSKRFTVMMLHAFRRNDVCAVRTNQPIFFCATHYVEPTLVYTP